MSVKLKIENVSKYYKTKKKGKGKPKKFLALQDLNLEIQNGEFLVVVGPSGCGKSTFLDIVAGLSKPSEGNILIDNKKVVGPALDRGIVFQGYALLPWRTVQSNVEYGLEIKKIPPAERAVISGEFLQLVGLENFKNSYPHELSGGMRQRVAIARSLAYDPQVLLMDEPFAAVDAQTREVLQDELLRIWEKTHKTIVFITHSIDEAIYLGDRVAVMTANPGTIKEIISVDLPRPRDEKTRDASEFTILRSRIHEILQ